MDFHRMVATKDLMKIMASLASGKKNAKNFFERAATHAAVTVTGKDHEDMDEERQKEEVMHLSLILVRAWAEGFQSIRARLPLFYDTYAELQRNGSRFPELSEEDRVVQVVPAAVIEPPSAFGSAAAQLHAVGSSEAVGQGGVVGRPLPDCAVLRDQCNLFKEVIVAVEVDSSL